MQQASEACPTKHMVLSNELHMREVQDTYSPPFKANWWGVKKAAFQQEGILHFVLSGYANLSYNFTNLVFVTSSLLFSVGVELSNDLLVTSADALPLYKLQETRGS